MLALTIKEGEVIKIGDTYIRLTEIYGAQLKIAIHAPSSVKIERLGVVTVDLKQLKQEVDK